MTASYLRQEIQDLENLMVQTSEELENGQEVVEVDISEFMGIFDAYYIQNAFEEFFHIVEDLCVGDRYLKVSL